MPDNFQVFPNIAKEQDPETLKKIAERVVEDYCVDLRSRSELDKRQKKWYKLFSGVTDPKNHPWENCSNVIIPILTIACHQSHARAFDALLPSKEIVKFVSHDGATINAAKRCQKYMNWQLTKQMKEWKKDMDTALLMLTVYGTVVKKTYYDHNLGRPVSETMRIDEFVAPYGVKNLNDSPRMTHVRPMSVNDIKKLGKKGIWINTENINYENTSVTLDMPSQEHKEVTDRSVGLSPSYEQRDTPRIILEQHRLWDLNGDDIEEPYSITVDKDSLKVLSIQPLTYTDIYGKERVYEPFTAYNFMPNPDSWMGFGFGHILEHPNRAINSLTNQLIDAGTLSNTIGGFVNKNRHLKMGGLKFKMGSFVAVDMPTDDIRKSIYEFQFKQPSTVLYSLLGMLQDYAQKVSSTPDSLLGQLPPSDTTATSMLTVMEQGMKVHSTIHRRTYGSFNEELEKIATLNSFYIDDEQYKLIQDSTAPEMQEQVSGLNDFNIPHDVVPIADPSITSRVERFIRAKQAYEMALSSQRISQDQEAMYYLELELFDAMEVKNVELIVKKPEPQEPPDLRPEEEEAEFIAERMVNPLDGQDHEYHLASHEVFKDNMAQQPEESLIKLSPQGKKLLDAHIKETMALLYLEMEKIENGLYDRASAGNEGLGAEPDYQGVPEYTGMGEAGIDEGAGI